MRAIAVQLSKDRNLINQIAEFKEVAQISSHKATTPELDITSQALKLISSIYYTNPSSAVTF